MSIQRDVEDMYKRDIEKQKKNKKKKKKNTFLTVFFVLVFLAAIAFLLLATGMLGGNGSGDGKGDEASAVSQAESQTETTTTETETEPLEYIGIKVSGSTYIYQGTEITLDNFSETIRLMSDNVAVLITDDNATQNAMNDLTEALEADDRQYMIEASDDDSDESSDTDTANGQTVTTLIP